MTMPPNFVWFYVTKKPGQVGGYYCPDLYLNLEPCNHSQLFQGPDCVIRPILINKGYCRYWFKDCEYIISSAAIISVHRIPFFDSNGFFTEAPDNRLILFNSMCYEQYMVNIFTSPH